VTVERRRLHSCVIVFLRKVEVWGDLRKMQGKASVEILVFAHDVVENVVFVYA
jgi:hypothetical protein